MSNEQLSAADALRFGAQVIELYDDATMKDDHMLDAGECAGVLLALAEYLQHGARLPAASEAEPTQEMIAAGAAAARDYFQRTGGNDPAVIYKAMRAAAPVIRNSRIAGDGEAGALPLSQYGYQQLFDAIAAATSANWDSSVNVSVQSFRDALAAPPEKQDGEAMAVVWAMVERKRNSDPRYCQEDPAGVYESVYRPAYFEAPHAPLDFGAVPILRQIVEDGFLSNTMMHRGRRFLDDLAAPPEKQASHSEGDAGGGEKLASPPSEDAGIDKAVDKAWARFQKEIAPTDEELEEFASGFADEMGCIPDDSHVEFSRKLLDRFAKRSHFAAPTVPHSLTVAQGDELRAALVRIRKHIGQHEIHGALKEVDAALTQLSGNSGELAQGERAAFEAHMNSTGFIWESDRERDVDGDEQYADVETRVNFGVWQAAIDWARQQGGGDAEQYVFAGTLCLDGYFISAKGRDDRGYSLYARMNGRPRMALDDARAQRAGNGGA